MTGIGKVDIDGDGQIDIVVVVGLKHNGGTSYRPTLSMTANGFTRVAGGQLKEGGLRVVFVWLVMDWQIEVV